MTVKNGSKGSAGANGTNGTNGKDGYTPVKGTDYWTPSDKAEIIQEVLDSIGCPVFGMVDTNNNIVLTGELPEANYNVKYEKEDGTTVDIGELSLVTKPKYTNLADPSSSDWAVGRLGSDGAVRTDSPGSRVTNYIAVENGDVVRLKGLNQDQSYGGVFKNAGYNASKGMVFATELYNTSSHYTNNVCSSTGVSQLTITSSTVKFLRFSGTLIGSESDVIITKNQPIE